MKRVYILVALIFLYVYNCDKNKKDDSKINNSATNIAQTNIIESVEQELIYISQEFDEGNYQNIIKFVNKYFKENKLNKSNLKLLFIKAKASEKLVKRLKKSKSKNRFKIAREYNLIDNKGRISYSYFDYKKIWEEYPETSYGKDSFSIYYAHLSDRKAKIEALEEYLDNVDNQGYQFKLFDLYMKEILQNNKNKYYSKLKKIYKKLKKNGRVKLDYILISKYLNKIDEDEFNEELDNIIKKEKFYSKVAEYIKGENFITEFKYFKAKEYFNKVRNNKSKFKKLPLYLQIKENIKGKEDFYNNIMDKYKVAKEVIKFALKYKKSKNKGIITGLSVRLRSKPEVKRKNVITTLNYGEKVIILKRSKDMVEINKYKNYWYKIELMNNKTGWIFGKYITLISVQ